MKKLLVISIVTFSTFSLFSQRPVNLTFANASNYKAAEPEGFGEAKFINKGQDITYTIFFQNNGYDTVQNVRIIDTISYHLDINSLRQDDASHPFEITVFSGNIVRFSFPNIRLPNIATDEEESKGFVQFTVSQKDNLPLMTHISNRAAIQFDFQPPIITNVVYHTIGEDFTNIKNVFMPGLSIQMIPNPVVDHAMVDVSGANFTYGEMQVYNLAGQLINSQSFNSNNFDLYAHDLPSGQLVYRIILDGQMAATGSFVSY